MSSQEAQPHSREWYARLAEELGGYRHPWQRSLDGPDVFALLGRESWLSFVKNKLRIAGWPEDLQDAMRNGLPYSLAGVIAGAPVEIRAQLLEAAIAGASREDLRALAVKLMPPAPRQRFDETRVVSVARQLGSVRLLRGLNDAEQKALDTWLKKMPPLLAERLKELE
ncbi:hypothetical protein E7T06_16810 [Deinococcus sp. Arct2-2]|uniref:hypothetical protein n=1 Tax=Deinococcus sp. Arct2-2 TaxID=2568653 RepID=UPI0010A4B81D|nr:hypothetical protein [Deinococcus sp. Arct2-2]THF68325.1 hypothetical protein E7T06_16810 [Deinococcus sp. Arct2-2]